MKNDAPAAETQSLRKEHPTYNGQDTLAIQDLISHGDVQKRLTSAGNRIWSFTA
jgi:hypothetical protein